MAFYDKFPYTNFQELNLDKLADKIGDIDRGIEGAEEQARASAASAAQAAVHEAGAAASATEAQTAQQSAQHAADASWGYAASIQAASQQIDRNTQRINNILVQGTPTEGNAELIDIRAGANGITYATAGDAVRGQFGELLDDIREYNSYNVLEDLPFTSGITSGLTITWSGEVFTISGTTNAELNYNIYSSSSNLPNGMRPGDHLCFHKDTTGSIPESFLLVSWYVNGGWSEFGRITNNYQPTVPANATGMLLRFYAGRGVTINGSLKVTCTRQPSNADFRKILPVYLPTVDVNLTSGIVETLETYKTIKLGPGSYRIANLAMPDNTTIEGSGDETVLVVDDSNRGIIPGINCGIHNLKLISKTPGHATTAGTECGIYIEGNGNSQPDKLNTKISNVTIEGFSGSGIEIRNTGYWCANSASIVNCTFINNYYGIYTNTYGEFNRVTNCLFYGNYYGIMNSSGNNTYVNCTITEKTTGIYIEGDGTAYGDSTSYNNGHGSFVGCTINHSDQSNGYAVITRGVDNGFIFDSCNIWYGKVLCNPKRNGDKEQMIQFSNCLFGGGTPTFENFGCTRLLINGCTFKQAPVFTEYPNLGQPITRINCYMLDGTAVN